MVATLQSFVLPIELDEWIKELAVARDLFVCRQCVENKYELVEDLNSQHIFNDQNVIKAYLLPRFEKDSFSEGLAIQPRCNGWLDIFPGQLIEGDQAILTLTTIQGENRRELPFKPSTWIQWLKKRSSLSLSCGVKAVNSKIEGQDIYKNICYSQSALSFYHAGGKWKQFVSGNVIFYPIS